MTQKWLTHPNSLTNYEKFGYPIPETHYPKNTRNVDYPTTRLPEFHYPTRYPKLLLPDYPTTRKFATRALSSYLGLNMKIFYLTKFLLVWSLKWSKEDMMGPKVPKMVQNNQNRGSKYPITTQSEYSKSFSEQKIEGFLLANFLFWSLKWFKKDPKSNYIHPLWAFY